MRISLTPRTTEFFTLFGRAGENALEVARLVERRFREHPSSGVTQEQVKKEETEGDAITRELITLLNTQYLTPFDREDIYLLSTTSRRRPTSSGCTASRCRRGMPSSSAR